MVLLHREGSIYAIDGKHPEDTQDYNKEKIEGDVLSVIQVFLAPNVLCKVSKNTEEMTKQLRKKLERRCQNQSLTTRMPLHQYLHKFKMESVTLLQDHLDALNKLSMDLPTIEIKNDEETFACALIPLTSKYHDIKNSMMYRKKPITFDKVWQTLNTCGVRRHFDGNKDNKVSVFFMRRRIS